MNILKTLKTRKRLLMYLAAVILLAVAGACIIAAGQHYFRQETREIVRDEFLDKFNAFYEALLYYLVQSPVLLGIAVVILFYGWMLVRLFNKFFNMFGSQFFMSITLDPRAIESMPHTLIVLFIYYTLLSAAGQLRFIMLISFIVVSIPFIYKMIEDVFSTAEKEGIVENYLVLPISTGKIVHSFWKRNITRVFIIPCGFFLLLMIYWEFLYSSIGITGDEKSAPGVFYNNYNDNYLMNFPTLHNSLILYQILLFALLMVILLYSFYVLKGNERPGRFGKPGEPAVDEAAELLVSCRGLTVSRTQEDKSIVIHNIHLDIKKGENICIMGESGCGKTTLVREIAGFPSKGLQKESGSITFGKDGLHRFLVFQDVDLYLDPYQSLYYYVKWAFKKRWSQTGEKRTKKNPTLDNYRLLRCIHETGLLKPLLEDIKTTDKIPGPTEIERMLREEDRDSIDKAAKLLVKGLKKKTKQKLSGGEKQKFYLLIAFILQPQLLVADEIFTDIDSQSAGKISNLLFHKDFTLVFISHDIGMVKELMDKGRLRKTYYLKNKTLHPEVWQNPEVDAGKDAAMPQWAQLMWQTHKEIQKETREKIEPLNNPPVIFEIHEIAREFDDGNRISFAHQNQTPLKICKGVNYALEGENGSGKTTLFKILTKLTKYTKLSKGGLLTKYKGIIVYPGEGPKAKELEKLPRLDCVRQNQLVFQKTGNAIIEDKKIKDYLLSFFDESQQSLYEERIAALIKKFFKEEKAGQIMNSPFRGLSVGEQRRILLIRSLLLLGQGGILFIDEAMRGMDVFLKKALIEYLKEQEIQVFLISHDKHLVDALCRQRLRLEYDKKTGITRIKSYSV